MTLEQAANDADIVSALAVVGGIAFRLFQLSEIRKQRRDVIAAELMRASYSVDVADVAANLGSVVPVARGIGGTAQALDTARS